MRRVSFGSSELATYICQAQISKNHDFHSLEVQLKVLASNNAGRRRNPYASSGATKTKSLFVVAVTSKHLTEKFFANNGSIVPYLNQTATSPQVVVMKRSLDNGVSAGQYRTSYGGNASSGRFFSLTVDGADIENLTIFAGILVTTLRTRQDLYAITSIDKLIAIRDGERQESNILLYTDAAKTNIWVGPSYQDYSGQWFRPLYGRPGSNRLYASTVPNTKVVFTSDTEEVLNRPLVNLPSTLYNVNKGINSKKDIIQNIKKHETNYFSSLYTAKIDSNDLALTFAFNKLDFFKNRGLFSDLIQNVPALINSFSLKSTKILRKRVTTNRPTNELTGGGANSEYADSEEIVTLTPTFPALVGPGSNILMVATTDMGANDLTYGYYAYGVEFIFIDNTYEKIKNMIDSPTNGLQFHLTNLFSLYKTVSLPDNYDLYSRQYTPQFMASQSWDAAANAIARYISVLNVFYKSLETELGNSFEEIQQKIYNITVRPDNGPEGINLLIQLITNLISEIDSFLKKRHTYAPHASPNLKTGTSKVGGSAARMIKVKYYFNEFVDAENLVNYGYDYLATDESDYNNAVYNPFKVVSYGKIKELLALESATYNADSAFVFNSINLTPNFFGLYGSQQTLNTTDPTQNRKNLALASLLAAGNLHKNSPIDLAQFMLPTPGATDQSDELSTMQNSLRMIDHGGCTIEVDTTAEGESAGIFNAYNSSIVESDDNLLDASIKLSNESPFVISSATQNPVSLSNFVLSLNNGAQTPEIQKIIDLNLNFVAYLTQTDYFVSRTGKNSATIKNITDRNVFRSANNDIPTFLQSALDQARAPKASPGAAQVSKILLANDPSSPAPSMQQYAYARQLDSAPVEAAQVATMALAFGTVRKAQYLAGFGQLNGSLMLQRPIWIDLTSAAIDNFSTAGNSILCRFVDETSQFSAFEGITAPIYNSLFILSDNTSPPVAPQISTVEIAPIPALNTQDTTDYSSMAYATAYIPGIRENHQMADSHTSENELKDETENLYTSGNDYTLSNGHTYVGYYHIDVGANGRATAAVGHSHSATAHQILKPISNRARRELSRASRNAGSTAGSSPSGSPGMPPTTPVPTGTGY